MSDECRNCAAVQAVLLNYVNDQHPDGPAKYGVIDNPFSEDARRLARIAEIVGVEVIWTDPRRGEWPTGFFEKT